MKVWKNTERAMLGNKMVVVEHSWPKRGSGKHYLVSEIKSGKDHQVIGEQLKEIGKDE